MKALSLFIFSIVISITLFSETVISQYGITWHFDRDYKTGQFVNGDFYVIDEGSGVTISSVTPAPSLATAVSADDDVARNGSMINPGVGSSYGQSYDSRALEYQRSGWVTFPRTLHSGDSLVSTISKADGSLPKGETDWQGEEVDDKAMLKTAAVLTVLSLTPPTNSFRPPFVGKDKPLYRYRSDMLDVLPALAPPSALPASNGFLNYMEYYNRVFQRPWLNHTYNYTAQYIHPYDNMSSYHRSIGENWNEASLILLINSPYDKELLLIRYMQTALDYYHMTVLGYGDSSFYVWPILFVGFLLDEPEIYNVFAEDRSLTDSRSEEKTYYWEDNQNGDTSSIVTPGYTWTGATVFFRKSIGSGYEHLHPSEWYLNNASWPDKAEVYRVTIDSAEFVGGILSAVIMSREAGWDTFEAWHHPPAFDYVNRWIHEDYEGTLLPIIQEAISGNKIDLPPNRIGGTPFIDAMVDQNWTIDYEPAKPVIVEPSEKPPINRKVPMPYGMMIEGYN